MQHTISQATSLALALALGCGGASPEGDDLADAGAFADATDPEQPAEPAGPGFPCAGAGDNGGLDGTQRCFPAEADPAGSPLVVIEYAFETYLDQEAVHVRLTFDPAFNDNQYGRHALGWEGRRRGHTFKDLERSDHADIVLVDADGRVVFDAALDYISKDDTAPCGYASLGVSGGDGKLRTGEESDVLGWSSSLDRNLNERGYCAYVDDSPPTDAMCSPSAEAPDWDYRIVYDLWVRRSAFEPAGFGTAHMDEVHASPSKADDDTVTVDPGDCPDDWCNDPDGCDGGGGGGTCMDNPDCPTGEFCGEGHCVSVVL